jgi:hypothetical protein
VEIVFYAVGTSVVVTEIGLWAGQAGVPNPAESKKLFLPQNLDNDSDTHAAFT